MEEKELITNSAPPAVVVVGSDLQPTRRVTWKEIVICLVVVAVCAVISSYLTVTRYSPRLLDHDSSQAAQLAQTMRDDWRKSYDEVVAERAALEETVEKLKIQVEDLAKTIEQHETQLAAIQAINPTFSEIKGSLDHATKTNDGLRKEADRILGDLGVNRIRVID